MTAKPLPGFRDFPPGDFALRAYIFAAWRRVATRYGFEEYDGPPLETLELYTAKSGDEIVGQLYNFVDKGGRGVALRPEMTPTLARMVAERANGLKKPIRWFSIPQLFRYERQQRGRLREHFQLNCDLIGEAGPLADAEIIALAIDVMREFGLGPTDVKVRLSDRRALTALLRARGVTDDGMYAAYQFIDKLERMSPEDIEKRRTTPQDFAPATADDLIAIAQLRGLAQVEAAVTGLSGGTEAVAPLRATVGALEAMGLGDWLEIDFTIVRGLAYYTGTVFELFDAGRSLRAICGGGRYDTLLKNLGGVDLPALGFGMGDVVLGELLKDRGLRPDVPPAIDAFLVGVTPDDQPHVLALAHELRDAGLRIEYAFGEAAVGRQLKLADARGARLAIVMGPDDRARGEVQLKDLVGKTQEAVAREALPARCRDLLFRMP
jgi:histidyl-tRNA synthetase